MSTKIVGKVDAEGKYTGEWDFRSVDYDLKPNERAFSSQKEFDSAIINQNAGSTNSGICDALGLNPECVY